jgi:hypothetical protein
MLRSETRVPTALASRYLQQFCKHWGHKLPVEFTAEKGHVSFAADRAASFQVEPGVLVLRIEASDEDALRRMEGIVVNHLRRFTFREDLGASFLPRSRRSCCSCPSPAGRSRPGSGLI